MKLFVFTPAGTAQFFGSIGLPPALAYVVIVWEIAAALALILGIWTSAAALIVIPDLLGAIWAVHAHSGFFFNNPNGGWVYPAFWVVALFVQALLGDGAFALRALPWPGRVDAPAHSA
ncbi:MAG: LysR family transcriptional regulator [Stutzerimonas stutzeri]|nr:MAG: LysR family transcriptional regulator [Stutzerimonas stutzeri]